MIFLELTFASFGLCFLLIAGYSSDRLEAGCLADRITLTSCSIWSVAF
jgi:hypothetical protein